MYVRNDPRDTVLATPSTRPQAAPNLVYGPVVEFAAQPEAGPAAPAQKATEERVLKQIVIALKEGDLLRASNLATSLKDPDNLKMALDTLKAHSKAQDRRKEATAWAKAQRPNGEQK